MSSVVSFWLSGRSHIRAVRAAARLALLLWKGVARFLLRKAQPTSCTNVYETGGIYVQRAVGRHPVS